MLESLRSKIPDFEGYLNEEDRRRSDELVRAYVGEALAALEGRVAPGADDPRFGALLLRSGFMNQAAFKAFEYEHLDDAQSDEIGACDLRLIELADRAPSLDAGGVDSYLSEISEAFDARDRAMAAAP